MRNSLWMLLTGAFAVAAARAEPPPLDPGLSEGIRSDLVQFEMRVSRKGVPVPGLSANDFEIELGGKALKGFTVDDMCRNPSVGAAPMTRRGSSLFYFDEPELTFEGRRRAVEVARLVAPVLLAHGHDLLILRNGDSVRAETVWTRDAAEVSAALDRIASDPGNRDYLRDAGDELQIERLIDRAYGELGANWMWAQSQSKQSSNGETLSILVGSDQLTLNGLAAALKNLVEDDLRRAGRDVARLQGAVQLLSSRGSPKSVVYFADTLRSDPGRVVAPAMDSLARVNHGGSVGRAQKSIAAWNADGAIQALVREASTYGARFYAVEGRGLSARTDWARTAQDTLAGLALETGGLYFVNGVEGSVIAEGVGADQSCWYLVSFDPKGWVEDRVLDVGVFPKQRGGRVSTRSSLSIPSTKALTEARLMAAYLGGLPAGEQPLSVSTYPMGGKAGRLQVLAQVRLPDGDEPVARDATWEVGIAVISEGTVTAHTSSRLAWSSKEPARIYETTLELPRGKHEIVAVARDVVSNSIHQGRVTGDWPATSSDGVALSVPAFSQSQRRGVIHDGEAKLDGIVVLGEGDLIDPREPVAIVTVVCVEEAPPDTALRAERSVEDRPGVSFAPIVLEARKNRCVQIRDLVAADSVGTGRLTYAVRVVSDAGTIASEEMTFGVADVSVD